VPLPPGLSRLVELIAEWILSPEGYVVALLVPPVVLGVADWRIRRRP
jgi:hypothetical protein